MKPVVNLVLNVVKIGNGRLARRGVQAVLPAADRFPYVIRMRIDITESNGSSSMASVCGASLITYGRRCST